jgi:hypothetical protein
VDIGLFNALGTDDKSKSVAELAEKTGVEPILLGSYSSPGDSLWGTFLADSVN